MNVNGECGSFVRWGDEEISQRREDCDRLIAVSQHEAELLQGLGHRPVSVLGHCRDLQLTEPDFAERQGLLFVGGFHGPNSPNYDSLCWFIDKVLGHVKDALGSDVVIFVLTDLT